jgi:hypothetical protein
VTWQFIQPCPHALWRHVNEHAVAELYHCPHPR